MNKSQRNRYRDIWNNFSRPAALFVTLFAHFVIFLESPLLFFLAKAEGGKDCNLISENQKANPMKKTILALALAAGLTSFAGSAKANINYSFSNDYSEGSGWGQAVTGTIFGSFNLDNTFNFKSISANSGTHSTTISLGDNANQGVANALQNIGGLISGSFYITNNNNTTGAPNIGVNFDEVYSCNYVLSSESYVGASGVATVVTDTAAVPEPSQVAASLLLAAGIAGFVIVKRRKEASELEVLAA